MISTAKSYLLALDINCNTQAGIINDFDTHVVEKGLINLPADFKSIVYQINQNVPDKAFAEAYFEEALSIHQLVSILRQKNQKNEEASVS
jgi:sulfite reductase (ferredoxin)